MLAMRYKNFSYFRGGKMAGDSSSEDGDQHSTVSNLSQNIRTYVLLDKDTRFLMAAQAPAVDHAINSRGIGSVLKAAASMRRRATSM
jgi:hypothetical protein